MKKMKTIPFDLAMAKEISKRKRDGEIVTREGNAVEILGFDLGLFNGDIAFVAMRNLDNKNIVGVVDNGGYEFFNHEESSFDLLLRVPDDTPPFRPFDKVLGRDFVTHKWKCDFFSHIDTNISSRYVCVGYVYTECIPYEGNEDLVGTTNEPKNELP